MRFNRIAVGVRCLCRPLLVPASACANVIAVSDVQRHDLPAAKSCLRTATASGVLISGRNYAACLVLDFDLACSAASSLTCSTFNTENW